jgi:putative DNA primase/helicase
VGADRIPTTDVLRHLHAMEERPWPEWRQGKPITPRQLARVLGSFGIRPTTFRTSGGTCPKGYLRSAFEDAFARYAPSDPQHRNK